MRTAVVTVTHGDQCCSCPTIQSRVFDPRSTKLSTRWWTILQLIGGAAKCMWNYLFRIVACPAIPGHVVSPSQHGHTQLNVRHHSFHRFVKETGEVLPATSYVLHESISIGCWIQCCLVTHVIAHTCYCFYSPLHSLTLTSRSFRGLFLNRREVINL
jgi:hypothetical protein